jgi:hypothetical protein
MKKIIIPLIIFVLLLYVYFYKANNLTKIITHSNELTTEEIGQISKSIVALRCSTYQTEDGKGSPIFGSASFLTIMEPKNNSHINILLTNSHVAQNPRLRHPEDDWGLCTASFNQQNDYLFYNFVDTTISNENQDISLLVAEKNTDIEKEKPLSKAGKPLSLCKKIVMGTKLYVFGYPGSSDDYLLGPDPGPKSPLDQSPGRITKEMRAWSEEVKNYNTKRNLILTEGIISGKSKNGYFTTAKIDTGNSGGLAVAKEDGEMCIVGIPTWVSVGELDSLGIIQPIDNIYSAEINWSKLIDGVDF